MIDLTNRPSLGRLVDRQQELWPAQRAMVERSLDSRSPEILDASEAVATLVLRLATHLPAGLDGLCADYRYLCEKIVLQEEIYFRRHARYRLSSFAEAYRECYSNAQLMTRYMNGLLLSNVFWDNHARAIAHYTNSFLPLVQCGGDFLEVGPGHGLFLAFAAQRREIGSISGWDVSQTSIGATRAALTAIGVERKVILRLRNLFDDDSSGQDSRFDAVVLSEILEHLEDPVGALRAVRQKLRLGGLVWVNVPINSPAPDHIYLLRAPEEACDLVEAAGFNIIDHAFFPMTGATLERARRQALSISCVIVGRLKETASPE